MEVPNLSKLILALGFIVLLSCSKTESVEQNPFYTDALQTAEDSGLKDTTSDTTELESKKISVDTLGVTPREYLTENVIILVIDGPRYSETWGDPQHAYIPETSKRLAGLGSVNTDFYNLGSTYTCAGHAAITTGVYEHLNNSGLELPSYPSIFQHFSAQTGRESYLIASKDKLEILSDTHHPAWRGKFRPQTDCGVAGKNTGYRADSTTYTKTFEILSEEHPSLVLINIKDPDYFAHRRDWDGYLRSIRNSDAFLGNLWDFIQEDPIYGDKTTLFVTNDHGRHSNGISDGFKSHGDGCMDCRHINFLALGPDFKAGQILNTKRSQIDIPATVAELLQFTTFFGEGEIMTELFEQPPLNL